MYFKILVLFAASVAVGFAATAPQKSSPKIVRPCKLNDYKCIGDNLAANSGCSKQVRGFLPQQETLYNFRFETPYFNASYIDQYTIYRNLNRCYVSEFFFNMDTDTSVLAVDCPRLDVESNRTLIQHRSLREDTQYSYKIRGEYPLIRLTTNLKHADTLDVCTAFTFTDVTVLPIFRIDPNDKSTANFLSRDLTFLNIYERETFFYRGPGLFRNFVNSLICNFGCNA